MTARTVNAIPTANTKLADIVFGAMFPSCYLAGTSTRPSTKSTGLLEGRMGEMCELLHTSNHHCLDGNNERLL
jgi:hypothetical protein